MHTILLLCCRRYLLRTWWINLILIPIFASLALKYSHDCVRPRKEHDDVIKWKHCPRYCSVVRGIHRSPVESPHKCQCLNKRLSKQSRHWWFETSSSSLWHHYNDLESYSPNERLPKANMTQQYASACIWGKYSTGQQSEVLVCKTIKSLIKRICTEKGKYLIIYKYIWENHINVLISYMWRYNSLQKPR